MKKIIKISCLLLAFGVLLVVLDGCSFNSQLAQLTSLGSDAKVTCYSGDRVIYDGYSSGKVSTENASDGWFFKDKKTGSLVRISGSCVIEN